MVKLLFTVFLLTIAQAFIGNNLFSQELQYEDEVYLEYIRSVKFHHNGLITSAPVIDLNSSGQLVLSFDDLEGGDKRFRYKIIHCDRNWQPTEMDFLEYMEGFEDEVIDNIEYSIGTFWDYTHYELKLPNEDVKWRLSGNYILAVFEDEYDRKLAITRRFMVVEPKVRVIADLRSPADVSKINTHHEIEFEVDYKDFYISNPLNEIEVVIMQNSRWDNAIKAIKPKFIKGDVLAFNYLDKLLFPALKEFRFSDLRSTKFLGEGVQAIDIHSEGIDVLMRLDRKRTFTNYHTYDDINGEFLIGTLDDNKQQLESEYVNVIFALEAPSEIFDAEVYVVGKFSDWKLYPWNKMKFDTQRNIFLANIELKQGYYDYYYLAVKNGRHSIEAMEGSWYETENDYTILIYYSEFGSRYDRLIGLTTINSLD